MRRILFNSALGVLLLASLSTARGQAQDVSKQQSGVSQPSSPRLQKVVAAVARASCRASEPVCPASVIKLFYLAAAERWMEDGRLKETEEVARSLHDMI